MTEDPLDAYATRLAEDALKTTGDTFTATTVLFQAAAAILLSKVGPAAASVSLVELGQEMGREMGTLFGVTATRQ